MKTWLLGLVALVAFATPQESEARVLGRPLFGRVSSPLIRQPLLFRGNLFNRSHFVSLPAARPVVAAPTQEAAPKIAKPFEQPGVNKNSAYKPGDIIYPTQIDGPESAQSDPMVMLVGHDGGLGVMRKSVALKAQAEMRAKAKTTTSGTPPAPEIEAKPQATEKPRLTDQQALDAIRLNPQLLRNKSQ